MAAEGVAAVAAAAVAAVVVASEEGAACPVLLPPWADLLHWVAAERALHRVPARALAGHHPAPDPAQARSRVQEREHVLPQALVPAPARLRARELDLAAGPRLAM